MIKLRTMRWTGYVARIGVKGNAHRLLVGEPEGRKPLRRLIRRWVDNIKMDLREIGREIWTGLICFRIGNSEGLLQAR
jgi:hypothetical protein